jgi:hypothetical protein
LRGSSRSRASHGSALVRPLVARPLPSMVHSCSGGATDPCQQNRCTPAETAVMPAALGRARQRVTTAAPPRQLPPRPRLTSGPRRGRCRRGTSPGSRARRGLDPTSTPPASL